MQENIAIEKGCDVLHVHGVIFPSRLYSVVNNRVQS